MQQNLHTQQEWPVNKLATFIFWGLFIFMGLDQLPGCWKLVKLEKTVERRKRQIYKADFGV